MKPSASVLFTIVLSLLIDARTSHANINLVLWDDIRSTCSSFLSKLQTPFGDLSEEETTLVNAFQRSFDLPMPSEDFRRKEVAKIVRRTLGVSLLSEQGIARALFKMFQRIHQTYRDWSFSYGKCPEFIIFRGPRGHSFISEQTGNNHGFIYSGMIGSNTTPVQCEPLEAFVQRWTLSLIP